MKRNIRNLSKTLSMLMLAGCMLLFTACGSGSGGTDASVNDAGSEAESEYTLMLSYANESYIESGDEALDKLIRNIPVTVDLAEDAEEELIAETIVNQLKAGSGTASRGGENFVTDAFALNYVLSSDGYCILDFQADGLEDLNETAEQFAVYQIVDSVLNTMDDIEGVTFTLDSEQVDSIKGGNMDWKMTYTREDVDEFMQVEIREADLNEAKSETQEAIQEQKEKEEKNEDKKETKKTDQAETKTEDTKKTAEDTSKKDADTSGTADDGSNNDNGSSGSGSDGNSSSGGNKTDPASGNQSSGSENEAGNGSSHDNSGTATDNSGSGNGSGNNGSNSSSDGGSSDSGSGNQSSSGTSNDSSSSAGTSADSGNSSSSGTPDGVVNDD